MRKYSIFLSCALLLAILTACGADTPILKVMIQKYDSDACEYQAVYPGGKTSKTDRFTPDAAAFYSADPGDFSASVVDGRVQNTLNATILTDDGGEQIEADETIAKMMQTAADTIDHDIWEFQAIVLGDRLFAFIKLNVNWQDPCILYGYDPAADALTELCRWDGIDLLGISVE